MEAAKRRRWLEGREGSAECEQLRAGCVGELGGRPGKIEFTWLLRVAERSCEESFPLPARGKKRTSFVLFYSLYPIKGVERDKHKERRKQTNKTNL